MAGRATCSAQDVHETTSHTYLAVHQRAPRYALLTSTLVCIDQGMAPLAVQAAFAADPTCPAAGAGRGFASRLHSMASSQGSAAVESPDAAQGEPAEASPSAAELSSNSKPCATSQLTSSFGSARGAAVPLGHTLHATPCVDFQFGFCMDTMQSPRDPQLQRSNRPAPFAPHPLAGCQSGSAWRACSPQVAPSCSDVLPQQHSWATPLAHFRLGLHRENLQPPSGPQPRPSSLKAAPHAPLSVLFSWQVAHGVGDSVHVRLAIAEHFQRGIHAQLPVNEQP